MNNNEMKMELNEQVSWESEQDSNLFFPVKTMKLVHSGKDTSFRKIVREDTDEVIAVRTNRYQVIENRMVHDIVMDSDIGFAFNRQMSWAKGNERFNLMYDIVDSNVSAIFPDSEKYTPKMYIKTSYDGSNAFEIGLSFMRMICSNLMVVPKLSQIIRIKHHKNAVNEIMMGFHDWIRDVIEDQANLEQISRVFAHAKNQKMIGPDSPFHGFMSNIPMKYVFMIATAISKYSKIPVVTNSYGEITFEKMYDLSKEEESIEYLREIMKTKKTENRDGTKTIEPKVELISNNISGYNENVMDLWGLYQMVIKLVQFSVAKNRRMEITSQAYRMLEA